MTPWSAWLRISPCATRSLRATANFGSIDGDPPAAYRYTEAPHGEDLQRDCLRDIEKETIDWTRNFDESKRETHRPAGAVPLPAGQR